MSTSEIYTDYTALGDYRAEIPLYLNEANRQQCKKRGNEQRFSFYLSSSDSLTSLHNMSFPNYRVLTVSGSGEFSHAFIAGNAHQVHNFDISPAAAFFSELRHLALCNLDMHQYLSLFSWSEQDKLKPTPPFINKDVYKKIEKHLSEEAKLYFESIFNIPNLINYIPERNIDSFARARTNRKTRLNRFIGDIIIEEKDYYLLQNKARNTLFTQTICDVVNMSKALIYKVNPDLVYLSNIGYYPQTTLNIAKKITNSGVSKVMFTLASNTLFYYPWKENAYPWKDMPVEIVGEDPNANYGLTLVLARQQLNPNLNPC